MSLLKILNGQKVQLRALEPEDLEFLYKWENDTSIWQVSNTLTPYSRFTLRKYIEESHLDIYETKQLRLMIMTREQPLKTIGTIDIFEFEPHHSRAGIGILIGDDCDRGKGYASDALQVVISYVTTILKLHQLFCNINTNNHSSLKLFQSNGFVITGEKKDWNRTNGGWSSEYLLQRINAE